MMKSSRVDVDPSNDDNQQSRQPYSTSPVPPGFESQNSSQPPLTMNPGPAPQPGPGATQPMAYFQPPPGYTQPFAAQPGVMMQQQGVMMQQLQQQTVWMPAPQSIPGCPPGLEYLTQIDQLLVHQMVEMLEAMTGFQTINRYRILNSLGQQVYFAQEEDGNICSRQCYGGDRAFALNISDNTNQTVIRISKKEVDSCSCFCRAFIPTVGFSLLFPCIPCTVCYLLCPANFLSCIKCCSVEMSVEAPVGQVIGYVSQKGCYWKPTFDIMDDRRNVIYKMQGPSKVTQGCICHAKDQHYNVYSNGTENVVGQITKQWGGAVEVFTNASNFNVSFSKDLEVKMKTLLLAATILIDFMFYEQHGGNQRR